MVEDLFDIKFASNQRPLLVRSILGLLELVDELNQIIMAGMPVDMLLMLSYQAVSDPVSLIHIAIVTQPVMAKKGFVGLLDQQVITGGFAIDRKPDEIGAAGGQARAPMKVVRQRLRQR